MPFGSNSRFPQCGRRSSHRSPSFERRSSCVRTIPSRMVRRRGQWYALTIGSRSVGAAPCRITPSAPRSNWRADRRRRTAPACRSPRVRATRRGSAWRRARARSVRGLVVEGAAEAGHQRIGAERARAPPGPSRWSHHQIAVRLQVGGHAPDRLLQAHRLGQVVADGREARPHLHRRRVAARPRSAASFTVAHAARRAVSSVKNVCSTTWSKARPPSRSVFGPNADEPQRDVLVERGVEAQERVAARPDRRGR